MTAAAVAYPYADWSTDTIARAVRGTSLPQDDLLPRGDSPAAARDLHSPDGGWRGVPACEQLVLPGFDVGAPGRTTSPRRREHAPRTDACPQRPTPTSAADPLVLVHVDRMGAHGVADKTRAAYLYQLRTTCLVAARSVGHSVTLTDLFRDPKVLGYALVHDHALAGDARLSKWTLAQRRSAIRSFATLLRPELEELLGTDPHGVVDEALRGVAERVGTGYRLTGGAARRRGGPIPTAAEVAALLDSSRLQPGYRGLRDTAFFRILAETGARVNALRMLDGDDCMLMPSGHIRLLLHAKRKTEPRQIELSSKAANALLMYMHAFNQWAVVRGWSTRIGLGMPGPVWRNSQRGSWPYPDVSSALRAASTAAQVPAITPHALRRAFATDAASVLPRHIVAQAGGWDGLERLDDFYIHPHADVVWRKLAAVEQRGPPMSATEYHTHATTPAV